MNCETYVTHKVADTSSMHVTSALRPDIMKESSLSSPGKSILLLSSIFPQQLLDLQHGLHYVKLCLFISSLWKKDDRWNAVSLCLPHLPFQLFHCPPSLVSLCVPLYASLSQRESWCTDWESACCAGTVHVAVTAVSLVPLCYIWCYCCPSIVCVNG